MVAFDQRLQVKYIVMHLTSTWGPVRACMKFVENNLNMFYRISRQSLERDPLFQMGGGGF